MLTSTSSAWAFFFTTSSAPVLRSLSVTSAPGTRLLMDRPIAPLPAHRSSTRGFFFACNSTIAASTSVSVSWRGISTRLSTYSFSPMKSARCRMYCTGSPCLRRLRNAFIASSCFEFRALCPSKRSSVGDMRSASSAIQRASTAGSGQPDCVSSSVALRSHSAMVNCPSPLRRFHPAPHGRRTAQPP